MHNFTTFMDIKNIHMASDEWFAISSLLNLIPVAALSIFVLMLILLAHLSS